MLLRVQAPLGSSYAPGLEESKLGDKMIHNWPSLPQRVQHRASQPGNENRMGKWLYHFLDAWVSLIAIGFFSEE